MKLIDKEVILMESGDKSITLTSHRIRQENKQWGKMQIKSIMLEHVSACEYDKKTMPLFLILGVLAIGYGALMSFGGNHSNEEIGMLAIGVGVVFFVLYIITIKKGLRVASSSTIIIMNTNGMKEENIKDFIDKIEQAIESKTKDSKFS